MQSRQRSTPGERPLQPLPSRQRRTARRAAGALLLTASLLGSTACATTPVTGRQSLNLFSAQEDQDVGAQAYDELLAGSRLITSGPDYDMVQEVIGRLVQVAAFSDKFDWEVRLIDDDSTANAWALPGGKMAVYTGILPFTQDATGLAVVMGHEIGHAVARHGTERMSQQMGVQLVLGYASGELGPAAQQYGALIANYAIFLPWGRDQELESDHIGLIYMAEAGYDPDAAVGFWQRMAAGKQQGSALDQFSSTHPSNQKRIEQIKARLPEARKIYGRSRLRP